MRLQAALAAGVVGKPKHGIVSSYDPNTYSVKVRLQPEDVETGWLPIETRMSGNGFGSYWGPTPGIVAAVAFLEGSKEVGWCTGFLPNDEDHPPAVPAGELWDIHSSGAFVKMLNDGSLHLQADANTFVSLAAGGAITSKGSWTHTGPLHTTQDITCDTTVTATTDVVGGGKHLKTHVHSGVQAGSSNTGAPV
jgi:phage baseplate assembly protein V